MLAIVALFGLMIGSFTNVLIGRYDELESIVVGRSHCPHCRHELAWYDLVPVLSFLLLRAHCRSCQKPISWRYPLIELLVAVLAVHLFFVYGITWISAALFAIFVLLIAIAAIDLDTYIVPDIYTMPALLLSMVVAFTSRLVPATEVAWGALFAGGMLAALVIVSRERWMGSGDIALGLIMGLLAGYFGSLVGMITAFCLGAVVGLIAMLAKKKKLKDMVPFGPFLVLGIYVATLYGNGLALWYLNYIHFY